MVNCKGLEKDLCLEPDCTWVDKKRKFCRTSKNKKTKSPIKHIIKIKRKKTKKQVDTPKTLIKKYPEIQDLDKCEDEPIRYYPNVQSHGCLIVTDHNLKIVHKVVRVQNCFVNTTYSIIYWYTNFVK